MWGASATLGKLAFNGLLAGSGKQLPNLDPLILAQSRTTIAFLLLAPLMLVWKGKGIFRLGRPDILRCLLMGTVGIAASNFLYYYSISKTTVATAIIVQYTAPVWVLTYMVMRRLQRPALPRVGAVALVLIGELFAIGILQITIAPPSLKLVGLKFHVLGVLAALGAAFSFSFYNITGAGLIPRNNRWTVFLYALLGAAGFWLIVNPPWKVIAAHYSASQWMFMLVFSVSSMLLPFSCYLAGLQYLDATSAIVTACLEPVFAISIAAVFAGETPGWIQAIGMVTVLLGTIIVQIPEDKQLGAQA